MTWPWHDMGDMGLHMICPHCALLQHLLPPIGWPTWLLDFNLNWFVCSSSLLQIWVCICKLGCSRGLADFQNFQVAPNARIFEAGPRRALAKQGFQALLLRNLDCIFIFLCCPICALVTCRQEQKECTCGKCIDLLAEPENKYALAQFQRTLKNQPDPKLYKFHLVRSNLMKAGYFLVMHACMHVASDSWYNVCEMYTYTY